ncbi:uncharacterized protein LOC142628999 [Castanea sativa]|uniref:uncharacterized protein LOC142628999 n=1 Tax=Castanea sativa TaxID=21020 RepID=UPI003F651A81
MEALTRLRQKSNAVHYKGRFEALSNGIRDLSENHKLSCFLNGLKDEVKLLVKMLNPKNLNEAFGLAKIQEEYLMSRKKSQRPSSLELSKPSILGPKPDVKLGSKFKLPLQRLSPAQMEERRKKGLCFNCDENFQPGHPYKSAKLFLLEGLYPFQGPNSNVQLIELNDNEMPLCLESDMLPFESIESESKMAKVEITLYALLGSPSLGTIRIKGKINGHWVLILIDTGSTHNFLDAAILSKLQLCLDLTVSFEVKVANRAIIKTKSVCLDVKVAMQGHMFSVDLNVLPLGDWISSSQHQCDPLIEKLLIKFASVFDTPFGLPLCRGHEHRIVLKKGTVPICQRPYKYTHFQKTKIEKIITDLLEVGSIRPSQSPFSSPILLVRKADGSWRMCIDYRALNQATIKDKFPIPVVDELLYELAGSTIFSKLDLRFQFYLGSSPSASQNCPRVATATLVFAAAELAFHQLKAAVSQPPILALPDFNQPFIIGCDASGSRLGAVLMQNHDPLPFIVKLSRLAMSSAYHPQTDGQTEVMNKCLEQCLRSFSTDRPTEWSNWLYLAEFWFNTNHHSATKFTPYEAVYGSPSPCLLDYIPSTTQVEVVDSLLQSRQLILSLLRQNLVTAQAKMKQQCDLHRSEREFSVGDWVFLRLQPYKQQSVAYRASHKLSPKFFGPLLILERIGEVAYKLDLPAGFAIHLVFHVSCLKTKLGKQNVSMSLLPSVNFQGFLTPKPIVVLQITRSHKLRNRTIT